MAKEPKKPKKEVMPPPPKTVLFTFYDGDKDGYSSIKLSVTVLRGENVQQACNRVFKRIYSLDLLESTQVINEKNQWEMML